MTLHKWHAGHVIVICHLLPDVCSQVLDIFSISWVCFSVIHLMKNASNFALLLAGAQNLSVTIGSRVLLQLIDTSVGSTVLLLIISKLLKPPAINVSD